MAEPLTSQSELVFTRMIVRDMKSPLAGLANLLETADRDALSQLKGEASQYVNEALGATEALEESMEFLLGVRKMINGEAGPARCTCDLFSLARAIIEGMGDAAGVGRITTTATGEPLTVVCDQDQMTRVVRHFLRLALKDCARDQAVHLQILREEDRIKLLVEVGNEVVVKPSVSDELGRTYCRMVAEAHGGTFGVYPEDGRAVRWWILLPCAQGVGPAKEGDAVAKLAVQDPLQYCRETASKGGRTGRSHPYSITSRSTREQFAVAVALIAVIPLLTFSYLVGNAVVSHSFDTETLCFLLPSVLALVALGVILLERHTVEVTRLRRAVETMSKGGAFSYNFSGVGEDFEAITRHLNHVLKQKDEKVKSIQARSHALVLEEQRRVMEETVGAACHHLGQPATVIRVYLDLMKKAEVSPEMRGMIQECQSAAEEVVQVLQRLQGVDEYKTESYLGPCGTGVVQMDERILKI